MDGLLIVVIAQFGVSHYFLVDPVRRCCLLAIGFRECIHMIALCGVRPVMLVAVHRLPDVGSSLPPSGLTVVGG